MWGFRSRGKQGPLVGERGLSAVAGSLPLWPLVAGGAPELGLSAGAARLGRLGAHGVSLDQGRDRSPALVGGLLSTGPPGSPPYPFNILESIVMAAPSFLILFFFLHQFS